MRIVEVLRYAKKLIERGWCQKWSAVDHEKRPVDPWDDNACEWCATGAIRAAAYRIDGNISEYNKTNFLTQCYIAVERATCHPGRLVRWNDEPLRTQHEVLSAFSKAITREENVEQSS